VWLLTGGERVAERDDAVGRARHLLADGGILAIKGLGGYHLACDARDIDAVRLLRRRKRRDGKPFALMAADLDAAASVALVPPEAVELLTSAQAPIVILDRRPTDGEGGSGGGEGTRDGGTSPARHRDEPSPSMGTATPDVAPEVAPGLDTLGIMLPYTPLHHLLLERGEGACDLLVMTSGNLAEEPIAYRDDEAMRRLEGIADAFLLHDRPIHMRCDDSVAALHDGRPVLLRRARGYAPLPVPLPLSVPPSLAVGGELKNVFCLARERRAFPSHHIGDLDDLETVRSLEEGIAHFERLFRIGPTLLACDLHPDYRATRYAEERAAVDGLPLYHIQHHHAHIAACLADNGIADGRPVIGVAFDGTGYGPDGAIWGGEFLLADHVDYERVAHLAYVPLPGGDAAIRHPCRTALAWLRQIGVRWEEDLAPVAELSAAERRVLAQQIDGRINAPLTSSIGRLFDAASAIAGLCQEAVYEAQAAIEFEAVAVSGEQGAYRFDLSGDVLDPAPALRELVREARRGEPVGRISARFHNGLVAATAAVCHAVGREHGIDRVALSGGVWQNRYLATRVARRLTAEGFEVYSHRRVPAGDGGLALGQLMVAVHRAAAGGGT
jgi:hydrogenase maturation protein HypF